VRGGGRVTPRRTLAAGSALLAVALVATAAALHPPPVLPATAPPGAFSAERALRPLRAFLDAGGGPRPAGSAANARAREHVVARLRALGLDPRVQATFGCGRYLDCTPIGNVVVRIPGRGPGRAVLLAAHLDSVPAGPGAADDASGVAAALEIARALLAEPAATDVVLLVDDAEESGLGGAEAFLAHPWAREVGAVVNLEARGTGGPSLLFETAGPGAWVASRFAAGARRPLGSSLFPEVYRFLPNDTDLTVLRRLGVPSANLAFIDGAVRYHTPRDDAAHLDPRTLQHQGENALALVRGLAAPPPGDAGEAVWFDVLGLAVVRVPERAALPLALAALALALLAASADVRRGRTTAGRVALGLAALPLGAGAAALLGFVAGRAPGLDPILRPWVASPGPLVAAFLLSGIAGSSLAALAVGPAARAAGLRGGIRIGLAGLAVGLAAGVPGASYLPLVPALVGGAAGLLASRRGEGAALVADLATLAAGSLVLLPPAWLLYPALGHSAGAPAAALVALAALPLCPAAASLPWRPRAFVATAPALLAAAALAAALAFPFADDESPERVVVYSHQDAATGRARILAHADLGRLPEAVRAAAAFSTAPRVALGWGALRPSFEAPAPPQPVPGPEVEGLAVSLEGALLRVSFRLRSPRGAPELQVAVPPSVDVRSCAVDGIAVPEPAAKVVHWFGGWRVYRVTAPPEGVSLELSVRTAPPFEIVVADSSPELPPAAAAVAAARPSWAVTQQEGDVSLFTRTVRIEAVGAASD
jgi:hypothetical protein